MQNAGDLTLDKFVFIFKGRIAHGMCYFHQNLCLPFCHCIMKGCDGIEKGTAG